MSILEIRNVLSGDQKQNSVSTLLMLLTLSMIALASHFAPDVLKGKG